MTFFFFFFGNDGENGVITGRTFGNNTAKDSKATCVLIQMQIT